MPEPDEAACTHIRRGDPASLDSLLSRDYAVADLLARAAAAEGTDTGQVTERAWQLLITDVLAGDVTGAARAALLGRVVAVLGEQDQLDPTDITVREFFSPPSDRWAGWWLDDHRPWPPGVLLPGPQVLAALRQVPVGLRVLLLLRDGAGLPAEEAERTVRRAAPRQAALLDNARAAYLAAIEGPATEGPATSDQPAPVPLAQPVALRALDVSCRVIFGLVGRWYDGDMDGADTDAYEQHLLFCPPCLAQVDKARVALAALRGQAVAVPAGHLRDRLRALIRTGR